GGGIFSFLPQSNYEKQFEMLFGTPLDLNFRHVADMYGGKYDLITDWDHFYDVMEESKTSKGIHIIEVMTVDRKQNARAHRQLWASVSREISRLLEGDC